MPEGDTIFKVARFMSERAVGQKVVQAALLGEPSPWLLHREVLAVHAHGKHLFVSLSPRGPQGLRLRVHLGMFGSWHHYPIGAPWQRPRSQARLALSLSNTGAFVCFLAEDVELLRGSEMPAGARARRGLGRSLLVEAAPRDEAPAATPSSRCHQAAFDDDLDDALRAILALPARTPVVDVLLNQRIAAGFGNVYKSELLFLFGLAPSLHRSQVGPWHWASVFARGRLLLQQNVGGWPRTTTVDRRRMPLPRGLPRLWVYNRTDKPCLLCDAPIVRAQLGRHVRATFWCPTCQPATQRFVGEADEVVWARNYAQVPWRTRRAMGPLRAR